MLRQLSTVNFGAVCWQYLLFINVTKNVSCFKGSDVFLIVELIYVLWSCINQLLWLTPLHLIPLSPFFNVNLIMNAKSSFSFHFHNRPLSCLKFSLLFQRFPPFLFWRWKVIDENCSLFSSSYTPYCFVFIPVFLSSNFFLSFLWEYLFMVCSTKILSCVWNLVNDKTVFALQPSSDVGGQRNVDSMSRSPSPSSRKDQSKHGSGKISLASFTWQVRNSLLWTLWDRAKGMVVSKDLACTLPTKKMLERWGKLTINYVLYMALIATSHLTVYAGQTIHSGLLDPFPWPFQEFEKLQI